MSLGLVGRKVGMTRIFTEDGTTVPVTVLDVSTSTSSRDVVNRSVTKSLLEELGYVCNEVRCIRHRRADGGWWEDAGVTLPIVHPDVADSGVTATRDAALLPKRRIDCTGPAEAISRPRRRVSWVR